MGLSREALEGRTIFEAFPPETAAVIEPLFRAALAGESTTFDMPYGGRMFTMRLSPILGDDGVVLAGMGFTQDVTENRLGEQQLRESEQRFRLAFEHAPIGIAIVGLDGLFREVNPALCRLTGYPSDRLRALTFQDITHPDDLDAELSLLAQLLVGELDSYAMEKRYYSASGTLVWVLLTVSLVLADDGEPLYFVSQIQDITDRKMREQATERVFRAPPRLHPTQSSDGSPTRSTFTWTTRASPARSPSAASCPRHRAGTRRFPSHRSLPSTPRSTRWTSRWT